MPAEAQNVLLVYPKFNAASFWNYGETCEMVGAKYPASPLGLITVAAMLPKSWNVRLVDRNVEELEDADLDWADMVMTGGMLPQQRDCLMLIERAQARGKAVVVGGPDVTSSPDIYAVADIRVLGEAESVIDEFLAAWADGTRRGDFVAPKFQADVTASPVPRFDLLKLDRYLHVGVQFSRGCPFTCEFCDIIELYGRRPRMKNTAQMLAELDALYALGYRGHVDFVDDNLIGNKKAVKAFLPHLADWQKKNRHPFELSTEASLNLAEDRELMELMRGAGFFSVFVGIESPDPEVLAATSKKQNTRGDISESVHKIYGSGMFVLAGFIVGFDSEKGRVSAPINDLIEDAAIPVAMVGMLYALPNTQLTRRLEKEGRLHPDHGVDMDDGSADQCLSGLNFDTLRPRAEILADYRAVVDAVYTPANYFGRVRRVGQALKIQMSAGDINPGAAWKDCVQVVRLMTAITLRKPQFRGEFWKTIVLTALRNPLALKAVLQMSALYAHLGPFSRHVVSAIGEKIEAVESGAWTAPTPLPGAAPAAAHPPAAHVPAHAQAAAVSAA